MPENRNALPFVDNGCGLASPALRGIEQPGRDVAVSQRPHPVRERDQIRTVCRGELNHVIFTEQLHFRRLSPKPTVVSWTARLTGR